MRSGKFSKNFSKQKKKIVFFFSLKIPGRLTNKMFNFFFYSLIKKQTRSKTTNYAYFGENFVITTTRKASIIFKNAKQYLRNRFLFFFFHFVIVDLRIDKMPNVKLTTFFFVYFIFIIFFLFLLRCVLYVFVPLSHLLVYTMTIDPLRQPQNPLGTRSEINFTINWVRSHLEMDPNVSIPKQDVYDEYVYV